MQETSVPVGVDIKWAAGYQRNVLDMPSPTVGADGARGSVPAGLEESADDKSRQRVLRKIFGVDDLEVSRNKAMIRLGVSEYYVTGAITGFSYEDVARTVALILTQNKLIDLA